MKAKIIKNILHNKFNAWMNSIKDESVKSLVRDNTIITGGAIASLLLNEDVNDYDVYFANLETAKAVAEYYVEEFKKSNDEMKFKNSSRTVGELKVTVGEDKRVRIFAKSVGVVSNTNSDNYQYFEEVDPGAPDQQEFIEETMVALQAKRVAKKEGNKYTPIFLTSNAITLSNSIQLIIRFYGSPDEIHRNYDFTHVTNYWTSDNNLVLKPEALEALLTKELRYQGSLYPLCSIIRTRKFIRRGWSINAGQYLKMAFQLHELDLKDPAVLADQLVGVDVMYFRDLISTLESSGRDVDSTYIAELVDEIF